MKKRDAYVEMWNTAYLAGLEWVMWAVSKFTGTNEVVVGPLLGKMPLAKPMTPENTPGKAIRGGGGGGGGGCDSFSWVKHESPFHLGHIPMVGDFLLEISLGQ